MLQRTLPALWRGSVDDGSIPAAGAGEEHKTSQRDERQIRSRKPEVEAEVVAASITPSRLPLARSCKAQKDKRKFLRMPSTGRREKGGSVFFKSNPSAITVTPPSAGFLVILLRKS